MAGETYKYDVMIDWDHDRVGTLTLDGKPRIQVAAPPEFDGVAGVVSPEDLFVASAASCMMTTFVMFSNKMRFEFKSYRCEGTGTLQKLEKGFEFTHIMLKSTVTVEAKDSIDKAKRALALAGKYCLVANSMKCPVDHENIVNAV